MKNNEISAVSYDELQAKYEKEQFKEDKKVFKANIKKHIKEFKPYDYGYMMNVIGDMLGYFYNFYSKKSLLHQDTDAQYQYPDIINSIEKAYSLYLLWHDMEYSDKPVHSDKSSSEILEEMFTIIGKNIELWWD